MLRVRWEDNRSWPTLVWTAPPTIAVTPGDRAGVADPETPAWRCVSSGVVGGGIGPIGWWVNAMVPREYHHPDPAGHVAQIAEGFALSGRGVGMLTAADVSQRRHARDGGVEVVATVGLGVPTWAAVRAGSGTEVDLRTIDLRVGTINLLVVVPVPLGDAALVNAVVTATEAKTQALVEADVPGTGTASDAVCIACPAAAAGLPQPQEYGGPRSEFGEPIARAVHAAVAAGTANWLSSTGRGDWRGPV